MSWRIVQITKPCVLKVKNKQLCYIPQEGEEVNLPLEDISVIILDHRQISFSHALLSSLAENGICLFSCDEKHLPSGAFYPFQSYYQYSLVASLQVAMPKNFQQKLWQQIIIAKIENQAKCLESLHIQESEKLQNYCKAVSVGDKNNIEAQAAFFYFKHLFVNFTRKNEDDIRNVLLNYGYAVLRACIARSLVGAGLMPCFGIHHANNYNAYNLADDIIEPFRPFVDYAVYQLIQENTITEITPILKNQLVAILTKNCVLQDEQITLLRAIEMVCQSLVKAIKLKQISIFVLPEFLAT